MARIRTVKPELFRHEKLFEAERETGLPLRISFVGLFTCCDREGRFQWRPRQLKLDCLPYDDIDFSRVLDALTTRGFLVHYENSGEEYGCIPTFTKHQVINNRERDSEIPDISDEKSHVVDCNGVFTRHSRVDDASSTPLVQDEAEGKGRERKGTGKGSSARKNATLDFATWPQMPSDQTWADYKKLRAGKKAPITQTVINSMAKELQILGSSGIDVDQALAICCERGWQGLKADWVFNHLSQQGGGYGQDRQSNRSLSAVERIRVANGMDPETGDFLDDDWLEPEPRLKDVN